MSGPISMIRSLSHKIPRLSVSATHDGLHLFVLMLVREQGEAGEDMLIEHQIRDAPLAELQRSMES